MISEVLCAEIEAFADRALSSSVAAVKVRSGELKPQAVANYLASLSFLLERTIGHLRAAAAGAERAGNSELAEYYRQKVREEVGHHRWADEDLQMLKGAFGNGLNGAILPSMLEFSHRLDQSISTGPKRYLAHVLLAEYFTVLAGPEWVRLLRENVGIPSNALTVVSRHVELDATHTEEGCQEIDRLLDPDDLADLRDALAVSIEMMGRFLDDVGHSAD
jgi:hypothetical protein